MMYLHIVVCMLLHFVTGEDRIIGGKYAFITEHPYQAVLYLNTRNYQGIWCGAVIVSPKYLLTAGHCAKDKVDSYTVVIGESTVPNYYDEEFLNRTGYKIENRIIHPNYQIMDNEAQRDDFDNDIAILIVKGELLLDGKFAKAIELTREPTPPGSMATVSGYGQTSRESENMYDTERFIELKAASLPIIDHESCVRYYNNYELYEHVTENTICAGILNGDNSCHGDSGGPLVFNDQLIGLVSYAKNCGGPAPGVFTSIYKQRDFIYQATNGELENEWSLVIIIRLLAGINKAILNSFLVLLYSVMIYLLMNMTPVLNLLKDS